MSRPDPGVRNNNVSHLFLSLCPVLTHSFGAVCHRIGITISRKPMCEVSFFLFCFSPITFLGGVSANTAHPVHAVMLKFPCQEQGETSRASCDPASPKGDGRWQRQGHVLAVLRTRRPALRCIKLRGLTPGKEVKQMTDNRGGSLSLSNLERAAGRICTLSS